MVYNHPRKRCKPSFESQIPFCSFANPSAQLYHSGWLSLPRYTWAQHITISKTQSYFNFPGCRLGQLNPLERKILATLLSFGDKSRIVIFLARRTWRIGGLCYTLLCQAPVPNSPWEDWEEPREQQSEKHRYCQSPWGQCHSPLDKAVSCGIDQDPVKSPTLTFSGKLNLPFYLER